MVTLTAIFLVSIDDPYMLLTMSIAEFEDKNNIAQSGGTECQTSPTARRLFEMNEKLYLLQLNESFQRCEGFPPNY